jgi:putative ubiquitin-RnfH superfamily antitoxin RatB of RatAB toxin-antitoxin module
VRVEVVYAGAQAQYLAVVDLDQGATVADAIAAARGTGEFAELDITGLRMGIFGRLADLATPLRDGDRVEIYRPLKVDPMQARHRRALNKGRKPV